MTGYLGEFEELVLLTIASLYNEAYGVSIKDEIERRCNRELSVGSLHSTIARLEDKGYLASWLGEPSQVRGGRRKRYFEVTQEGKAALREVKSLRDQLWKDSKVQLSINR